MPFVKVTDYRDIPFSSETPKDSFYNYASISDLAEKCERSQFDIIKCRTIGVLFSEHGQYYIKDVKNQSTLGTKAIHVSVMYLHTPPQSAVIPYTVQVCGDLQWQGRPVLYANILHTLHPAVAVKMQDSLRRIQDQHLAAYIPETVEL